MQFYHRWFLVNVNYMKLVYVRGLEEDGAKFWLKRVGWEPSEVARKIAQENDPEETSLVAEIGGGHGREALWLAEQCFQSILVEPKHIPRKFARLLFDEGVPFQQLPLVQDTQIETLSQE